MTGPSSRPQVTIIGSALSGNKGAAAMLESAMQTLDEEVGPVDVSLLSMYPQEDAAQNQYPNLTVIPAAPRQLGVTINSLALIYFLLPPLRPILRRRSRAISALASSSVLLDQGGITFTDGREKFLLYNIASILPALFVRTPVFKCAQAIGPFGGRINRLASKVFLPRSRTIVTRGRITHEYAERLGLENIVAGADFAFALELAGTEEQEVREIVDLSALDGPSTVVGVCPSVVMQNKVDAVGGDYVGIITEFIESQRAEGHTVVLIPHSVRTGTDRTHNNDLPLCHEIYSRLDNRDGVLFVDRELSSQQLRWLIGRCDLFVASRFHAMVSALAMAVPTIVIGWSHKYREVLEMFDAEEWAFGADQLSSQFLAQRFTDLQAQREAVRAKLDAHLPEVKATSRAQANLIAHIIANG